MADTPHVKKPLDLAALRAAVDRFREANYGRFPSAASGWLDDVSLGRTWLSIARAFSVGLRGLPSGGSLPAWLDQEYPQERGTGVKKPLDLKALRAAVTRYREAHNGEFPDTQSGPLDEANLAPTWLSINMAFRHGHRGLPGGSSLAEWLSKEYPREYSGETLDLAALRAAVDRFREANYGRFPTVASGSLDAPGLASTWDAVNGAFRRGFRGLPGGGSLSAWLDEEYPVERSTGAPKRATKPLDLAALRAAVTRFRQANEGRLPNASSGALDDEKVAPSWASIDVAFRQGHRGLAGGSSLSEWIAKDYAAAPAAPRVVRPLDLAALRAAVDRYREANGRFPNTTAGPLDDASLAPTWASIDESLRVGHRGLPGGSSLAAWLDEQYKSERAGKTYTDEEIRTWAAAYKEKHGRLPAAAAGRIEGLDITWDQVNHAFQTQRRGVSSCSSLSDWLDEHFPMERGMRTPRGGNVAMTADWVRTAREMVNAYRAEHNGDFPTRGAGQIQGSSHTWRQMDNTLQRRGRSLAYLLEQMYPAETTLTEERLRRWVERYVRENRVFPRSTTPGPIPGSTKTWIQIDRALRANRDIDWTRAPSLATWLDETYPTERNLLEGSVRTWVKNYALLKGAYPDNKLEEPVAVDSMWTWQRIDSAMRARSHGWSGPRSLRHWIEQNEHTLPRLPDHGEEQEESDHLCAPAY